MERPNLVPHLTPKEQITEKMDKHLADLRARIARIQDRLGKETKDKLEAVHLPGPENSAASIPLDGKRKAAGEEAEKEYVMKDGQLMLKEFAE